MWSPYGRSEVKILNILGKKKKKISSLRYLISSRKSSGSTISHLQISNLFEFKKVPRHRLDKHSCESIYRTANVEIGV